MKTTMQDGRKRLISAVHVGKTQLGLDDDTYRALLEKVTGQRSAAKLTYQQLNAVLDNMKAQGFSYKKPAQRRQSPKSKGTDIDRIRAIWITMSKQGFVRDGSEAALDAYVKRMTAKLNNGIGVEHVAWLKDVQVEHVMEALKNWHRRLMADALIKQGLTVLSGHRKSWPTVKAPYGYVSSAYESRIL